MSPLFLPALTALPSGTRARASGRSRRLPGTRSEAVLLLHGFTGRTEDMLYLGSRLSERGFPVSIPRLPGHGTNHVDFLASTWRDWLRAALDAYIELASEYEAVDVAGLSMGGVIAVILSAEFRPRRIALAAPALRVNNPGLFLAPLAGLFVKRTKRPNLAQPDETADADQKYMTAEYWNWQWIAPAAHLLHLKRIAGRLLGRVTAPALTIVSKGDTTVPVATADYLESRIGSAEKRRVVLERSGHVVVNDCEKEYVADQIVEWFSR